MALCFTLKMIHEKLSCHILFLKHCPNKQYTNLPDFIGTYLYQKLLKTVQCDFSQTQFHQALVADIVFTSWQIKLKLKLSA